MRNAIKLLLLSLLFIISCDQAPTTLEEEPYKKAAASSVFSLEIRGIDFDFLTRTFYMNIAASSPQPDLQVTASLHSGAVSMVFQLLDNGLGNDILVNDGLFDEIWQLPDSLESFIDSSWTLSVDATDGVGSLTDSKTITPVKPVAPEIQGVDHQDTLSLRSNGLTIDTLQVTVSHTQGLDEIRGVSMMSLKPNGEYANNGQPIPLYDDGGTEVFFTFQNIEFTSGDSIAGDGIYSLLLALDPLTLTGTYEWSFTARSWLGMDSETLIDSLIVLPAQSGSRDSGNSIARPGVFK